MSIENTINNGNMDSDEVKHPSGTAVMIKDMKLVPIRTHLVPIKGGEVTLPPIIDDRSAEQAASTLFTIEEKQKARARLVNAAQSQEVPAKENLVVTQAFQIFPPINGTPQGEQALAFALASRLTQYGMRTNRWPGVTEGRTIRMASVTIPNEVGQQGVAAKNGKKAILPPH